jgi:Helix-turn-helix domain
MKADTMLASLYRIEALLAQLVEEKSNPYLDAEEAARFLRRTVQAVYALVKRGRLNPVPRIGTPAFPPLRA